MLKFKNLLTNLWGLNINYNDKKQITLKKLKHNIHQLLAVISYKYCSHGTYVYFW